MLGGKQMNLFAKLSISALAAFSLFSMSSCSPNTPAQRGFEKAKQDIKENLKVPSSFKVTNAQCYYVVVEEYIVSGGYPYQYCISYSAKNSFNADVISTNYYGWNDEYASLKYYGTDSSKFDSARSGGKKQDIKY